MTMLLAIKPGTVGALALLGDTVMMVSDLPVGGSPALLEAIPSGLFRFFRISCGRFAVC